MTTPYPDLPVIIKHPPVIDSALVAGPGPLREGAQLPTCDSTRKGHFAFTEKSIRQAFIRKVYSILMVQLLISAVFIAGFRFNENLRRGISEHPETVGISFLVGLVVLISMSCCVTARRVSPINYMCLFAFTIAESFLLGAITIRYRADEVLLAVGICALVCFALTVYAFQTKRDFTTWGAGLFAVLVVLFIFGLACCFYPSRVNRLFYCAIGCLLFSFYIIYDTQLLIGGDHKYSISPEEYVFAALNLYIDVVQLFLMILRLGRS